MKMMMKNEFNERYNNYLDMINNRLDELLIGSQYNDDIVCDGMRYSVENGGKRIRPVLVLECCRICGGDISKALDFACALEMIHTYSLIHDDLPCMDDDDLRRGKPSCHKQFGESYALLAGDALLTYAFEIIASSKFESDKKAAAVICLSRNAGFNGMIGGQVVDLRSEGQSISYERLKTMHNLKTGCLIRCAVQLGAIAAGAKSDVINALTEYADNIGLAFQIVDDILDVTGCEEELGKPIGSDAQSGKTTYVTLFGLEKSQIMANEATENALNSISKINDNDFLITLAENLAGRKS